MEIIKKKKVLINGSRADMRVMNIKVAKARSIEKPKTKPFLANKR